MSRNQAHTEEQPGEELSPQELAQRFVMWVELMIHDLESVPDEENLRYWCPQWWAHPEAVNRLNALHAAYQQAVSDELLSSWWTHQWDSHSRILFGPTGPFEACRYGHNFHEKAETYKPRLRTEDPPPYWTP